MKPKLIANMKKDRWIGLQHIKEFTISKRDSGAWAVTAWVSKTDCFICGMFALKVNAEEWLEKFNE